MCLDQNNWQGWYGDSFVQVLAAAAGLTASKQQPDCTGIDFQITTTHLVQDDYPQIQAQVKSWSAPKITNGFWSYRGLTEKRFNALAGGNWRIPRLLFLVVVPHDGSYARADDHMLRLSHAAYWISLGDVGKIAQPSCERRVQVLIPMSNLLTVETLTDLCEHRHPATRMDDARDRAS